MEVYSLDIKYKSLFSGGTKTFIPQFQPVKKVKNENESERNENNEHIDTGRQQSDANIQ